jgi:hypothetical protein
MGKAASQRNKAKENRKEIITAAMNSIQEKELLAYLERAGFTGGQLERDIKENISQAGTSFRIKHKLEFGEESMLFELHFIRDVQFDAYRLEKYRAIYREDVKINHKIVDGIDTALLEERMRPHDWEAYFSGKASVDQKKEMATIVGDLSRLRFSDNDLYRELMIKYSPDYYFEDLRQDMSMRYEASRDFHVGEQGLCNAALAYYIVSDRLGNIHEDLSRSRLDEVIGTDLYHDLERHLSDNKDEFELRYPINNADGYYELLVPVKKENGWHTVDHYSIEMTPHSEISHGVFNGIDTRELEGLMKEINWNKDSELFIFHEDSEPEFRSKVGDVQEMMFRLGQDIVGCNIADHLQVKYWATATFFGENIPQTAWDEHIGLPKRQQEFPIGVPAKNAMNLLAGRAVLNVAPHLSPAQDSTEWIRFDLTKKDSNGQYAVVQIDGMGIQDVDNHLDLLPIKSQDYYPLRASLLRGDVSSVTLSNEKKILLKAWPEQKKLNIFSPDMRPIPFNFRFDPDWKPEQVQDKKMSVEIQKNQQRTPKVRLNNSYKKGKGKGL